jgi:hypothetical protein
MLPRLDGSGVGRVPALLRDSRLTALVFWNRGCPECTAVAMGMQELADSVRALGGQVIGVPFGPDDPVSIQDQLRKNRIAVPQLWDAGASVAARYELGVQHLRVFLVDREARVHAAFDDQIPSLLDPVLPEVRSILLSMVGGEGEGADSERVPARAGGVTAVADSQEVPIEAAQAISSVVSAVRLDARLKLLSTDGAQPGDKGLYNEPLENGALFLYRYDIRMPWTLTPGVEVVPWLRLSNEKEEVLTEGAEQLTRARGSASLNLRLGPTAATLGAFPLRVAPLLLQRWDRSDAPPLGGVSGCACGAGAGGVSQRSLEVLEPEYTFEGLSVSHAERWATLRAWLAIPRWENAVPRTAPALERLEARYRRVLYGTFCDLGTGGARDAESGLPSPLGLRVGVVSVEDDGRTLGPLDHRPLQHDERGWLVQARLEPVDWLSGDAQVVDWRLDQSGYRSEATAYLAGIHSSVSWRPASFWMRAHRLRTEPDFAPLYRALTYDPNQDGWRIAGGLELWPIPGSRRERVAASAFYRRVRETEEHDAPGLGRTRSSVLSLSLGVRPVSDLLAELHAVETKTRRPLTPLERSRGLSLSLRWERWPFLDPQLRVDAIRRQVWSEVRNIWQMSAWVRVVR